MEYVPLEGHEDEPPKLANTVIVSGGTDAVILTFYYVSGNTHIRMVDQTFPRWVHVQRAGDVVTVRGTPIARIALPFGVAVETILDIIETLVGGAQDIADLLGNVPARFKDLQDLVTAFTASTGSAKKGAAP